MSIPGGRRWLVLDVLVLIWVAAWIVLGVVVAGQVRDLKELADTVVIAGEAVGETGDAVRFIRDLPFVGELAGDELDDVERRIEEAARSATSSGRASRESVDDVAVLLGLSIALIPTVPLLALYLIVRWRRVADALSVRRALRADPHDPALRAFLAHRAVEHLRFDRLRLVSDDPVRDLAEGRFDGLADAELGRLGLRASG